MGRFFFVFAIVSLFIAAILFFPIYLETDCHYDMNRKKFAFALFAYKKIKLLGGYATTYQGGVALHLSEKKAVLLDYSEMEGQRKKFSFTKTFKVKALELTMETGAEYLLGVAAAQTVLRVLFFLMRGDKEKIRNNLWLTDGDILRVSLRLTVFFNAFILLKSFLKFLKEKIKSLCLKKTKKSTV